MGSSPNLFFSPLLNCLQLESYFQHSLLIIGRPCSYLSCKMWIIFHGICKLHHFLSGFGDFIPLNYSLLGPKLQTMREGHILGILFLHGDEAQKGYKTLNILSQHSQPISLAQVEQLLPIQQDFFGGGDFSFNFALKSLWSMILIKKKLCVFELFTIPRCDLSLEIVPSSCHKHENYEDEWWKKKNQSLNPNIEHKN